MTNNFENQIKVRSVFRPNSPINQVKTFVERVDIITNIFDGIFNVGQHTVVFGERGVGKTSVVSVLDELFNNRDERLIFSRYNCDSDANFSELWRRIFRGINLNQTVQKKVIGLGQGTEQEIQIFSLDKLLPNGNISPDDIRAILQQIPFGIIVILDEFDRITDPTVRRLMADTIKSLSDHSLLTTLILVGVADTVDELIGDHASIERALVQVHVPRMSSHELRQILSKCLDELQMTIRPEARNSILLMSKGLPHYTHLLGMHAAIHCLDSQRSEIIHSDVEHAVHKAIADSSQSMRHRYFNATPRTRNSLYPDVVLSCALSETDGLGFFDATEIKHHLSAIRNKTYEVRSFSKHLSKLSSELSILERVGDEGTYRYRFINPLMQPFILMKGIQDEKIEYETLSHMMGME